MPHTFKVSGIYKDRGRFLSHPYPICIPEPRLERTNPPLGKLAALVAPVDRGIGGRDQAGYSHPSTHIYAGTQRHEEGGERGRDRRVVGSHL